MDYSDGDAHRANSTKAPSKKKENLPANTFHHHPHLPEKTSPTLRGGRKKETTVLSIVQNLDTRKGGGKKGTSPSTFTKGGGRKGTSYSSGPGTSTLAFAKRKKRTAPDLYYPPREKRKEGGTSTVRTERRSPCPRSAERKRGKKKAIVVYPMVEPDGKKEEGRNSTTQLRCRPPKDAPTPCGRRKKGREGPGLRRQLTLAAPLQKKKRERRRHRQPGPTRKKEEKKNATPTRGPALSTYASSNTEKKSSLRPTFPRYLSRRRKKGKGRGVGRRGVGRRRCSSSCRC